MRSLFFATCLAIGAGSMAIVAPAQARVSVDLPGIHIGEGGHHGDWRRHDEWRGREGYREHGRDFHGYRNYGYNGRPDWR